MEPLQVGEARVDRLEVLRGVEDLLCGLHDYLVLDVE